MAEDGKDTSSQTGEPKLIAGKYKTVEEAENALREKDALIGRQSQELGSLRKQVHTPQAEARQADTQSVDADNEQLAHALLVNPKGVLQNIVRQMADEMDRRTTLQVNVALTMDRFLASHALAKKHHRLFRAILSEVNLPEDATLEDRLAEAYKGLEAEISSATAEHTKRKDAERRTNDRIQAAVVEDGGADPGKGKPKGDEAEVDTPDSYLASRASERERLQSIM